MGVRICCPGEVSAVCKVVYYNSSSVAAAYLRTFGPVERLQRV